MDQCHEPPQPLKIVPIMHIFVFLCFSYKSSCFNYKNMIIWVYKEMIDGDLLET